MSVVNEPGEQRQHPEDIKDDWIFIKSKVPLTRMVKDESYTMQEYLQALRGQIVTALYHHGELTVFWRGSSDLLHLDRLTEFMTPYPLLTTGSVQAVTGEGVYLKEESMLSQRFNWLFADETFKNMTVSTRFFRNHDGNGSDLSAGWTTEPPSIRSKEKEE